MNHIKVLFSLFFLVSLSYGTEDIEKMCSLKEVDKEPISERKAKTENEVDKIMVKMETKLCFDNTCYKYDSTNASNIDIYSGYSSYMYYDHKSNLFYEYGITSVLGLSLEKKHLLTYECREPTLLEKSKIKAIRLMNHQ